jgi:hypothetical protein
MGPMVNQVWLRPVSSKCIDAERLAWSSSHYTLDFAFKRLDQASSGIRSRSQRHLVFHTPISDHLLPPMAQPRDRRRPAVGDLPGQQRLELALKTHQTTLNTAFEEYRLNYGGVVKLA